MRMHVYARKNSYGLQSLKNIAKTSYYLFLRLSTDGMGATAYDLDSTPNPILPVLIVIIYLQLLRIFLAEHRV